MSNEPQQPGRSGGDAEPPNRRWVKIVVIVVAAVVLIVVAMMLLSGGEHGPWQHMGGQPESEPTSEHTPPAGVHP
ncbi:MAG: hypothetical protein QM628_04410 [Propionicimonas sp.]